MITRPNILVCSDFSETSREALLAAEALRKKTDGNIFVLHVSEHEVMWDWLPERSFPLGGQEEINQSILHNLGLKLQHEINSNHIKGIPLVTSGIPHQVIIEEASARKIDLIFMGHGGSLSEKVVATSPLPVFLIQNGRQMQKMAALVDPENEMQKIINWSEEMSYLYGSELSIVSLFPDISSRQTGLGKLAFSNDVLNLSESRKEEIRSRIREDLKKHLTKYVHAHLRVEVSAEKKLAYHLNSILLEEKIDLAIMKRHQSSFLEKIIIGSETRRMIEIFRGNLLILPS